jgi:hypothetical protein
MDEEVLTINLKIHPIECECLDETQDSFTKHAAGVLADAVERREILTHSSQMGTDFDIAVRPRSNQRPMSQMHLYVQLGQVRRRHKIGRSAYFGVQY